MNTNGVVAVKRRLSRAEAERLISEFEQSGLRRKEFCEAHGLNVFTLDAWRKRIAQSKTEEKIVPIEIVEDDAVLRGARQTGSTGWSGQFRVVLSQGLRIEVEAGFDAAELRRLIAALDHTQRQTGLSHSV
jgi:transposase-like protein